jgi:K+-transporting ATPase KdpF subunit
MLDLTLLAAGVAFFAASISTSLPVTGSEEASRLSTIRSRHVTVLLLIYLAYALLRPERF